MKIILLLLAVVACARTEDTFEGVERRLEVVEAQRDGRIVNGQAAATNQFPHQALLIINGNIQCGGSLISDLWILTAQHCVNGIKSARIYLGSTNRGAMPVVRNAVLATWLVNFGDIALIKLDSSVPFTTNVRPIGLPSRTQGSTNYAYVILRSSGFGGMANGQLATFLQFTDLIGITMEECRSIYGSGINSAIICTRGYPNRNQGTCGGDSGSGLTTRDSNPVLVGVTSFAASAGCAAGLPQGFVRLGSYLDWISRTTGVPIRN